MKLLPDTLTIMQKFVQTRVKDAAAGGVVLGLSGGIDSATTLSLAVSALGAKNVSGLIMPFKDSVNVRKFLVFLDELRNRYFYDDICIYFDNLAVHRSHKVKKKN